MKINNIIVSSLALFVLCNQIENNKIESFESYAKQKMKIIFGPPPIIPPSEPNYPPITINEGKTYSFSDIDEIGSGTLACAREFDITSCHLSNISDFGSNSNYTDITTTAVDFINVFKAIIIQT